jgi:peroxiredoxin
MKKCSWTTKIQKTVGIEPFGLDVKLTRELILSLLTAVVYLTSRLQLSHSYRFMHHALRILNLKFFLSAMLLILMSHATVAQGCFGKCLDHLSQPLRGSEDLKARFEKSDQILKGLIGCKAPDFEVTTLKGERLVLSQLRGKVVVINFWFEACSPCIAELPALNKLSAEYQRDDVVFIAFGRDSEAEIDKFLETKKFDFKMVSGKFDLSMDYCVISGWPMNLVLDKKGIVRYIKSGGKTDESASTLAYDEMKPVIEKHLNK